MAQTTNEDRLYLLDASGSMGEKIAGRKKLEMAKAGLRSLFIQKWPVSYYDVPLRVGVIAFRLLGIPGKTVFEVIVPLYPPPVSLQFYLLDELGAKGGSWVADGLRYAQILMKESERGRRRIDFISDGSFEGPDPTPIAEELRASGIVINSIEMGKNGTKGMHEIADRGGGRYSLVQSPEEFLAAIQ